DMEPFFRNLHAIGVHDAEAVLETIEVPALVITGDRDLFTPRALAQQMARRIPNAEILIVRGGTHYTCVEFPELVNLRVARFSRDRGFYPRAPRAAARALRSRPPARSQPGRARRWAAPRLRPRGARRAARDPSGRRRRTRAPRRRRPARPASRRARD